MSGVRETGNFDLGSILAPLLPVESALEWADLIFHAVNKFDWHFKLVKLFLKVEGVDTEAHWPEVSLLVHDGELSHGVIIDDSAYINELAESVFIINKVLILHHIMETFVFRKRFDVLHGLDFKSWDF